MRVIGLLLLAAELASAASNGTFSIITVSTPTPTSFAAATTSTVYTQYYVNLTYFASPTCGSAWTFQTEVSVDFWPTTPTAAITTKPGSTSLDTYTGTDYTSTLTDYWEPTVLVRPEDVSPASLSSLQSYYAPPWATECALPAETLYTPGETNQCEIFCITQDQVIAILVGTILGWFLLFFLFGLVQNFYYFRELCLGREARRGLPRCWSCLGCPLSCVLLFCSRRGFVARPEAEWETLQAQWDATPWYTRVENWLRWGFGTKYPTFLGPAPDRRRKNKSHPAPPRTRGAQPALRRPPVQAVYRPASPQADGEEAPPPYSPQDESIALPAWSSEREVEQPHGAASNT